MGISGMSYEQKYLKYKEKYLNLKNDLLAQNTHSDVMNIDNLSDTPVNNLVGGSAPMDVYKPCTTFPCGERLSSPNTDGDDSGLANVNIQQTRSMPKDNIDYNMELKVPQISMKKLPPNAAFRAGRDMYMSTGDRSSDQIDFTRLTDDQKKKF